MRRKIAAGVLAALLLIGALLGWAADRAVTGPGPLAEPRDIVIPQGGTQATAAALLAEGAIASIPAFRLAAWWTRAEGPIRAAEFAIPAHASPREILSLLRTARPVQHHLTIPEGLTAAQIEDLVSRTPTLAGPTPRIPEGTILPETYAFERGTPREALLARAARAMDRRIAEIWDGRAPNLPLATPADLVTLASIIERETARPDERPKIAAVYLNRLRRGMRLQADPTVSYAASGGQSTDRPPTRTELDLATPYNTYRFAGLPPGPIGTPGPASLIAAAHPAASDALYFVADGTGGHAFAATLDEHNRNVARWRGSK